MQEFGPNLDSEVLQNKKRMDACDLICMVYDSADANSFAYVATLREKFKLDHLPIVYIATKSDLDLVAQRHLVQPDQYCRSLGLSVPTSVSMKTNMNVDLFNMLIEICINPYIFLM
jgi:Ras family protein T1